MTFNKGSFIVYFFRLENTDKLITCIDNNSDDSVLCVGTEQTSSESLLLFFDIRQRKTSFTFSDSHKDDITDLKFHPTLPNLLASGSTDGLINVFDVMNSDEDDALLYCLNTESSVQTLNWHEVDAGRNKISCITHLNDFIVYDVEESEQIVSFKRSAITKAIRRKSPNECYLVNAHSIDQNNILLLAGSNFNKGECLRTLSLTGKELSSRSNIEANKQIVRCSAYDAKVEYAEHFFVLVTNSNLIIINIFHSRMTFSLPLEKAESSLCGRRPHRLKQLLQVVNARKSSIKIENPDLIEIYSDGLTHPYIATGMVDIPFVRINQLKLISLFYSYFY